MSDYSVLIVGAGPTGLELAAELNRYGINFLIIDKHAEYAATSNAAAIHARTLECWNNKPWFHDIFNYGKKMHGVTMNVKNKRLASLDFSHLKSTQFPLILSVPQHYTEKVFNDYLKNINHPIMRNTTLLSYVEKENKVYVELMTPEGKKTITTDWLVGCDGYHSTVREISQISFEGEDVEERFLLMDVDLDVNYEQDQFHLYLDPRGLLAFFPMPQSTRIMISIKNDAQFQNIKEPTIEILNQIIQQRTSLNFSIKKIIWQSHFWVHERLANKMRQGRIFLAGDAGHVHSPAGGQGMNTGIQDTYNLAWKLAYVIKRYASEKLLESYEIERKNIAKQVIQSTSLLLKLANLHSRFLMILRNTFLPWITKLTVFKNIFTGKMSELTLSYPKSNIIDGKKIGKYSPGDRFFDENFNDTKHHLVVFHASETQMKELMVLKEKNPDILALHFYDGGMSELSTACRFNEFTLCLVRPDQYIAYIGNKISKFKQYLDYYLQ